MSTRFTIPVQSFRHISTPFDEDGKYNAIAIVHVADLPDLKDWRRVNVREVKKTGRVPDRIRGSLETNSDFVFLNRGLVVTVDDLNFDNKTGQLTVSMSDPETHGLLDGGHTYEIVTDERDDLEGDQYIRIELLKGFRRDEILDIVEARNTSNQVQNKSLLNLQGAFEPLRQAVKGTRYANKIAYKENVDEPIDIRDLISYLYAFVVQYDDALGSQPTKAYQSKAECLNYFEHNQERFQGIYPIARDIFELWDYIHLEFHRLYNEARGSGRFGNLTGVVKVKGRLKPVELHFIGEESEYRIPDAMKYPILAAFRAVVEVNPKTGEFYWGKGVWPVDMLRGELGQALARQVGESIMDTRNPNKTGRSTLLWESCYQAARIAYLEVK